MPKQRDSSAALRTRPESSTDEIKKPSSPPDWATIRLRHAWHRNRRNKRCVTLLAKINPETPEGMPPEP